MSESQGWLGRVDSKGILMLPARLVLGGFFVHMGLAKVAAPGTFLKLIREYETFSDSSYVVMNLVAAVLPWMEILCGLMILAGVALRGNALLMIVMLSAFSPLLAIRANQIVHDEGKPFCAVSFDCGCGSGAENICMKLAVNAALWLLAWVTLISRYRKFAVCADCAGRSGDKLETKLD
jgi:uncharacterized membrane protein YphA (DoxX/SURF4 family)